MSGVFSRPAVTAMVTVFLAAGLNTEKTRGPRYTQMQFFGKSLSLSLHYLIDSQLSTPEQCNVICFCVFSSVTLGFVLYYWCYM